MLGRIQIENPSAGRASGQGPQLAPLHLHGRPVPASDLRRQVLPKDKHLFAIRRANMRRKFSLSTVFTSVRSKQEQVGKIACCEPREPAAVIHPPECQAPVTLEAVPAQIGDLESFVTDLPTLRLRPNTLRPPHSRDKQIRCEPAAV